MTQPIQDKPAELPLVANADTPAPSARVPTPSSMVPARRGLETDDRSSLRRHLSRRVRRLEPGPDGS